MLPCGPDGGLCLHCTAPCSGPGVCSLWRPSLLSQILEAEGKYFKSVLAMLVYSGTRLYKHAVIGVLFMTMLLNDCACLMEVYKVYMSGVCVNAICVHINIILLQCHTDFIDNEKSCMHNIV